MFAFICSLLSKYIGKIVGKKNWKQTLHAPVLELILNILLHSRQVYAEEGHPRYFLTYSPGKPGQISDLLTQDDS